MDLLSKTISNIEKIDYEKIEEAKNKLNQLLKPQGSLGKLETIAQKLAGITKKTDSTISEKTIIVMASDNGVTEEKISSFPKNVSALVAETMVKNISGVAVLAKHAGANLQVVDIGLDTDENINGVINRKIRKSTSNIAIGPAMTKEEAVKAIEVGIEITNQVIDEGVNLLGTGEVGIGNTTTSSAILHALTDESLENLVGRGAGLTDDGLENKKRIVEQAVKVNHAKEADVLDILSTVGGFDIAGLVGCYLAAASRRIPIVIDGFISGTAAVVAYKLKPEARDYMFASHLSVEPGTQKIIDILQLDPMLNMGMRLGEGTGCALAFNIIEAATKIMNNMGTFADIGM